MGNAEPNAMRDKNEGTSYPGGRREDTRENGPVQKIAGGITSHELSWRVKAIKKNRVCKAYGGTHGLSGPSWGLIHCHGSLAAGGQHSRQTQRPLEHRSRNHAPVEAVEVFEGWAEAQPPPMNFLP